MQDGRAHPLLAQVPLTVSPFISFPTATTLPYTWKALPSMLPPSATEGNGIDRHKFVIAASGHAAHPDEIIESCQNLRSHLQKVQEDAKHMLQAWESEVHERELAEKRRVAPGWLDREEKILEPQKKESSQVQSTSKQELKNIMDLQDGGPAQRSLTEEHSTEGEQLDLAFGGMKVR